jgi:proline dehydrogenase
MLSAVTRTAFSLLAGSTVLKKVATAWGLRRSGGGLARRFVAGLTDQEAIEVAARLEHRGLMTTLDLLGEHVASADRALASAREYVALVDAVTQAGISRHLSVKLTQIGLEVDRATAIDNLRRIVDAGAERDVFVRVDMEGSAWTDATLEAVQTLWRIDYRNVGVAIQAALRRSPADIDQLNEMGISVRLVKGAYRERRNVAFTRREEVEEQFLKLMQVLLVNGHRPAIATHDPRMIEATRQFAAQRKIAPDAFDFELLYGIRRDLQRSLANDGHRVRIYVPYGREWYPYFMRRLGERPANIAFVLRSLVAEEREP